MKKVLFWFFWVIVGLGFSIAAVLLLPRPFDLIIGFGLAIITTIFLFCPKKKIYKTPKIKIGRFTWTLNDFCRGWLITGQTGSGKTACAIRTILHALYRNCPNWGGAVVDQKGQFYEIVSGIAEHYNMSDKLIVLRTGKNIHNKYNLLSYPGISWASYAGIIIDTAESMGIKLEPFWKSNAETVLYCILALVATRRQPTLADLVDYVGSIERLSELANDVDIDATSDVQQAALKLSTFLELVAATRDGILSSTRTMVSYFADPAIQEIFCPDENTVDFADIDKGKIFVISMEQKYDRQRMYFNTFLKLLFTTHAKYRFDDPATLQTKNLLVFVADEAQQVVTASQYSSDHEAVSVIREARATYILATQSITSFASKLKREDVNTLVLNLSNKIYFTVADQDAAELAAKDLGMKITKEISKSVSKGIESISSREIEKPLYSAALLRGLKKYECVLKHANSKTERMYLPPRDDAGNIPSYYYRDRFGIAWYLPYLFQL